MNNFIPQHQTNIKQNPQRTHQTHQNNKFLTQQQPNKQLHIQRTHQPHHIKNNFQSQHQNNQQSHYSNEDVEHRCPMEHSFIMQMLEQQQVLTSMMLSVMFGNGSSSPWKN